MELTEGPLLILAGAGSGKTRVITYRIAHLIKNKGVHPSKILAITFTNKAAREMKDRIEILLGEGAQGAWIGTFHATCVRILRRDIEKLGRNRNFAIYDTGEQIRVMKDCIKLANLNEKNYPPARVLSEIGKAKDRLIDQDTYTLKFGNDFYHTNIGRLYKLYQEKLVQNDALDFDDIIMLTVKLFETAPPVKEYYQKKFNYIHVDEYQDTNHAQFKLIEILSGWHNNLCVVGDDDQSIYMFRGADITNILSFEKTFKNAKVIKLEQNYRSTKNILYAANCVIENNLGRKKKTLWTDNPEGYSLRFFTGSNEHEEASYMAVEIKEMVDGGEYNYKDFAVLYRMNAQSRVLEERLMRQNIPYRIFGGLKFYDRKEIKDLLAYLRLVDNTGDDYALKRVINVPRRGLGQVSVDQLENLAAEKGISMFEAAGIAGDFPQTQRAANRFAEFYQLINRLMELKDELPVSLLIGEISEQSGILDELRRQDSPESRSRIENITELISAAMEFESGAESQEEANVSEFLSGVSLVSDIDDLEENNNYVVLTTVHSAKGLEFPVVFLAGMEEGIFPGFRAQTNEQELEEERRLCYVAITRAMERLYLCNTHSRTLFGKTTWNMASRFIEEIPRDWEGEESLEEEEELFSDVFDDGDFDTGDIVMHSKFGKGVITGVSGRGKDKTYEIVFNRHGMKRLMAIYANLTKP